MWLINIRKVILMNFQEMIAEYNSTVESLRDLQLRDQVKSEMSSVLMERSLRRKIRLEKKYNKSKPSASTPQPNL